MLETDTSHLKWFRFALVDDIGFNCGHKDIGKSNCHFSAHCSAVSLKVVLSTKLEGVLLEYKSKHFPERIGCYQTFFLVEIFVCFAYSFDTLFFRNVGVQAGNVS